MNQDKFVFGILLMICGMVYTFFREYIRIEDFIFPIGLYLFLIGFLEEKKGNEKEK